MFIEHVLSAGLCGRCDGMTGTNVKERVWSELRCSEVRAQDTKETFDKKTRPACAGPCSEGPQGLYLGRLLSHEEGKIFYKFINRKPCGQTHHYATTSSFF